MCIYKTQIFVMDKLLTAVPGREKKGSYGNVLPVTKHLGLDNNTFYNYCRKSYVCSKQSICYNCFSRNLGAAKLPQTCKPSSPGF